MEDFIISNLKRISLDTNYVDSLIFKLNFEGSRVRQGLEPSQSCLEVDPKNVQKNLKKFVDYLEKASKIEQALAMQRYIKNIVYSKESIQINLLCLQLSDDRQSLKNPAPLLNIQACGWVGAAASPASFENSQEKSRIPKNTAPSKMAPRARNQAHHYQRKGQIPDLYAIY